MNRLSIDTPFASNLSAGSVRRYREALAAETLGGLWRRRRLILATALLSLAIALTVLLVLGKKYTSETVIQLEFNRSAASPVTEQMSVVNLDSAALIQGEVRMLRSRAFARDVIKRLNLESLGAEDRSESWIGRRWALAIGQIATLLPLSGSAMQEAPPEAAVAAAALDRAALKLMTNLNVATDFRSYLITIQFSADDPDLAARIANGYAAEYIEQRMQSNVRGIQASRDWIAQQTRIARAELTTLDREISEFRQSSGIASVIAAGGSVSEDATQQRLRELTSQLSSATLTRINEGQRLERIQDALRNGIAPPAGDLQSAPLIGVLGERITAAQREIASLRSRFGDRHPSVMEAQAGLVDLRSQMAAETRRVASIASTAMEGAKQAEAQLRTMLDALQRAVIVARSDEAFLNDRQIQAQSIRDRLAALGVSAERYKAAQDLPIVPASIVVEAEVESRPAAPRPSIVLGFGLLAGIGLGMVGAYLLEKRDQGLRTSGDITPDMETRCLAMMPELRPASARQALEGKKIEGRASIAFEEAVRLAATSAGLFEPSSGCRVVLITSALPGEGKSVFGGALGRILAQTGRRVLVLDVVRSSVPSRRLVSAYAFPSDGRAVADRSVGSAQPPSLRFESCVNEIGQALDVNRVTNLIGDLRSRYDVILLEGAPVTLVADSLILSRLADTVLLVSHWAKTKQKVVEAALRRFREHSVAVDGVLLTRVVLSRHAKMQFFDDCSFYTSEHRFFEALEGARSEYSAVGNKGV